LKGNGLTHSSLQDIIDKTDNKTEKCSEEEEEKVGLVEGDNLNISDTQHSLLDDVQPNYIHYDFETKAEPEERDEKPNIDDLNLPLKIQLDKDVIPNELNHLLNVQLTQEKVNTDVEPMVDFYFCNTEEVSEAEEDKVDFVVDVQPNYIHYDLQIKAELEEDEKPNIDDLNQIQLQDVNPSKPNHLLNVQLIQEVNTDDKQNFDFYLCQTCDFRTKDIRSLWRHKQIVHDGIRFQCNICEYKATRKTHLSLHLKSVHVGFKFVCDQCDYKASQEGHLKRHKDSKHGLASHFCSQCEYKTSLKANLKNHIKAVHEGRRFKCEACGLESKSKSGLSKHKRAVHQEIRFKCKHCNYESSARGNVRTHTNAVHEHLKLSCEVCDFTTGYPSHLTKHHKMYHTVE